MPSVPTPAVTTLDDQARDRLDAFLARLERLELEDLRLLSLPLPDPDQRAELLADLDRAANAVGRRALVEDARSAARDATVRAYTNHQYDPTWVALNWARSLGTTKDRLGLILAAQDAAVAAVLSDVLDDDLVADLSEPFEHAAGMAGSTISPSLAVWRHDASGVVGRIFFGATIVLFVVSIALGELWWLLVGSIVLLVILAQRRQTA